MQPPALAARELAHRLLLVRAAEVEPRDVRARGHLEFADADHVLPAGDFLPDALGRRELLARLLDVGHAHGFADGNGARVRLLAPSDHANERRLARAVRADDADDRARRHLERELFDEQPLAVALGDVLELDYFVPQPLGDGDEDLLGFVAFLVLVLRKFFKASEARLGLRLSGL